MLQNIIKWFQPPTFPDDEDKTRSALLLNVVLNTLLVVLPVIFVGIALADFSVRHEIILNIVACGWVAILGTRVAMLAGRVPLAGTLTVLIIIIATTFVLYNRGTIRMPAVTFYILAITIAGLTINRRAIIWTAVITVVTSTILLIAEKEGILPKPDPITANISQAITLSAVFMVISILLYLAIKSRDEALTRLRHELVERAQSREREARRREMMERVVQIGKAVTEQTSDLRTALFKIWNGVRTVLNFDRVATFLYDPETSMFQGSYGTDRAGNMSEEWGLKFGIEESNSFFRIVLSQPDGFFFTHDYETERGLLNRPDHIMRGVKYYASVGVWAGDKPVAIICVDQLLSRRIISEEQLEALRFFAGYAGLAIENARLSEREQKRREMMEKVIEIGKIVTEQTTDLHATLFKIRENVRNNLDFDRVAFFLYDSESNTLQGSYGTDRSGNLSEEWDLRQEPLKDGLFNRPDGYYFTKDYESDFNITSDPEHPMRGVKQYAAVACWSGEKPVGMICVDQLISGRPISEEQLDALHFFAGYAGLAIENAHLGEREQRRQKMMEKVIQIGKEVAEQVADFRTTLFKIWESIRNHIDLDRVAVFLYNASDSTMQGSYGTDRSGNLSEEWGLRFTPSDDGFLQRVISRPNGFYHAKDYELELRSGLPSNDPMKGVKQYAAVSCWSGDKPIAVICTDQLISGRIITEEQLEALRLFAGYAGLAIENARLNTELKNRMQEREQFIQELGSRNAELERFTYTVSHDLRSPIITIKGFIGMLDKDMREGQRERVNKDMLRISNATDKMDSLLSDLLELSRIGRLANPPEKIDLVQLAYDTLETVDGRLRAKNISTHIAPDLPVIHGDRVRIGEVLENLLDNAAKYMGEQKDPHIEIGIRKDGSEQVIYVKDNGMGIDPQYLQRIFGLFEKLDPTGEGTGIGLALIKRIIEVHGGDIWAESEGLGKGSTFCFTIPIDKK